MTAITREWLERAVRMSFGVTPAEKQIDKFWEYVVVYALEESERRFQELCETRKAELPPDQREQIIQQLKGDILTSWRIGKYDQEGSRIVSTRTGTGA